MEIRIYTKFSLLAQNYRLFLRVFARLLKKNSLAGIATKMTMGNLLVFGLGGVCSRLQTFSGWRYQRKKNVFLCVLKKLGNLWTKTQYVGRH